MDTHSSFHVIPLSPQLDTMVKLSIQNLDTTGNSQQNITLFFSQEYDTRSYPLSDLRPGTGGYVIPQTLKINLPRINPQIRLFKVTKKEKMFSIREIYT